ncbi:hypothetical protein DFI02_110141 [Rhizobium sp. PP-F2F-G20b]|nr:hypothetical protein DFI02_110141 [Rhizobium sp. PP-F2F-G20b]
MDALPLEALFSDIERIRRTLEEINDRIHQTEADHLARDLQPKEIQRWVKDIEAN